LTEGLPYRIYGGQRFYDRLEIRNALAYLRLVANRHDDAAFERVINTPPRGLGSKTVEGIRSRAREEGCSLWEASQKMLIGKLSARAGNSLRSFMDLIEQLDEQGQSLTLDELCEEMLKASSLYEYHGNEKGEKGQARVENLEELVNACRVFTPQDGTADVEGET